MLDLDNFKLINHTHGHICGDTYLKVLADSLVHIFSENCGGRRKPGDEFLVFMYRQDTRDRILERVREFYSYLKTNPFPFPDGTPWIISISSGAAFCTDRIADYEMFLEQADNALYKAKRGKRNIYCSGRVTGISPPTL